MENEIESEPPWYFRWYTIGGASAIIVGGVLAVILLRGSGEEDLLTRDGICGFTTSNVDKSCDISR